MIRRTIELEVEPDGFELANEFCEMDSDNQAIFFDTIWKIAEDWDSSLCFQIQEIIGSTCFTKEAARTMRMLGDFA